MLHGFAQEMTGRRTTRNENRYMKTIPQLTITAWYEGCQKSPFAVIETRTVSGNKLQVAEVVGSLNGRSLRVYGGIKQQISKSLIFALLITDYLLVILSTSQTPGVTGVTGNMTVTLLLIKYFTVTTQNTRDVDQNNEVILGLVHHFTRHHGKTSLGTIPSLLWKHSCY